MNERIQALIEQCKHTSTTYFDGRGNVTETYFDKEKFAKLIVRECLDEIANYKTIYHVQDHALGDIRTSIKEKFGVE